MFGKLRKKRYCPLWQILLCGFYSQISRATETGHLFTTSWMIVAIKKKQEKKIYKIRYEWLLRKLCLLFILVTINFWLKVLWVFFPQQTTCIKVEFTFSKSVHSYLLMSSKFICFSNNVTPPPPKLCQWWVFFWFFLGFFYVSTCIDVHKLGGKHQSCKVTYL